MKEKYENMTLGGALIEARKRWGAAAHTKRSAGSPCEIGTHDEHGWKQLGVGEDWQAAFADAEKTIGALL